VSIYGGGGGGGNSVPKHPQIKKPTLKDDIDMYLNPSSEHQSEREV
jgi:hypothetical protein